MSKKPRIKTPTFRVDEDEWQVIESAALLLGIPPSVYVRETALSLAYGLFKMHELSENLKEMQELTENDPG